MRGIFVGMLLLGAADAVLSTRGADQNISGLLGAINTIVRRVVDPNVAAIPRKR